MGIAKVVEVNSSSTKSFEDAIQTGIAKVTETVKNVSGAWVNEQKVVPIKLDIKNPRLGIFYGVNSPLNSII